MVCALNAPLSLHLLCGGVRHFTLLLINAAAANSSCCPAAELMCFLRDAVDTRKPPLMEVALDAIQKLISFKLLQGPVHHINHRWGWCRQQRCLLLAQMPGQRWMHASCQTQRGPQT